MASFEDLVREVGETKDQLGVVRTKLQELAGVVVPLMAAAAAAQAALATAQERIAELEGEDAAEDEALAEAAATLDAAQQETQAVLDGLPPGP